MTSGRAATEDEAWPWSGLLCQGCDQVGIVKTRLKRELLAVAEHWVDQAPGRSASLCKDNKLFSRVIPKEAAVRI